MVDLRAFHETLLSSEDPVDATVVLLDWMESTDSGPWRPMRALMAAQDLDWVSEATRQFQRKQCRRLGGYLGTRACDVLSLAGIDVDDPREAMFVLRQRGRCRRSHRKAVERWLKFWQPVVGSVPQHAIAAAVLADAIDCVTSSISYHLAAQMLTARQWHEAHRENGLDASTARQDELTNCCEFLAWMHACAFCESTTH